MSNINTTTPPPPPTPPKLVSTLPLDPLGGHYVENPQTGCHGTSYPSLVPGREPIVIGPIHNTGKKQPHHHLPRRSQSCGCLYPGSNTPNNNKDRKKKSYNSSAAAATQKHIDRLVRQGIVSPEDLGVLRLRLQLRVSLPEEMRFGPRDEVEQNNKNNNNSKGTTTTTMMNEKEKEKKMDDEGGQEAAEEEKVAMALMDEKNTRYLATAIASPPLMGLLRGDTLESFPPLEEDEEEDEDDEGQGYVEEEEDEEDEKDLIRQLRRTNSERSLRLFGREGPGSLFSSSSSEDSTSRHTSSSPSPVRSSITSITSGNSSSSTGNVNRKRVMTLWGLFGGPYG